MDAPSAVKQTYLDRTTTSAERYAAACKSVAGGNSRGAAFWKPHPLTIRKAEGPYFEDVDGHRYFDMTANYTAMVHGHAYPPIVEAVTKQVAEGSGWAANCQAMVDLADQLTTRVASVDQVRFTNSGTEAALLGLAIARTATGRHKVLMARHGYHGSLEEFESGTFDHPGPNTYLATYGDANSFREVLAEHGDEIAAVFLEPVMGAGGIRAASLEFLESVKRAAHEAGALFVLDEVITYRMGTGGRQGEIGFDPDLTMFGKLIGGGFPVGAIGGKAELMKLFDPDDQKIYHSGTYNANPVTMTAGNVSVRELTAERIQAMAKQAERLEGRLADAAADLGMPFSSNRVGSLLAMFFQDAPPRTAMDRSDGETMGTFHLAALNNGVYLAPRGMTVLSTIHTDGMVDEVAERLSTAMRETAEETQ